MDNDEVNDGYLLYYELDQGYTRQYVTLSNEAAAALYGVNAPQVALEAGYDMEPGYAPEFPQSSMEFLAGFNLGEDLAEATPGSTANYIMMLDDSVTFQRCTQAACFAAQNQGDGGSWTPEDDWLAQ